MPSLRSILHIPPLLEASVHGGIAGTPHSPQPRPSLSPEPGTPPARFSLRRVDTMAPMGRFSPETEQDAEPDDDDDDKKVRRPPPPSLLPRAAIRFDPVRSPFDQNHFCFVSPPSGLIRLAHPPFGFSTRHRRRRAFSATPLLRGVPRDCAKRSERCCTVKHLRTLTSAYEQPQPSATRSAHCLMASGDAGS